MKIFNYVLTFLYGIGALYSCYMAILNTFIYVTNTRLGHYESPRLSIIYWVLTIIFIPVSYIGYRIINQLSVHLILKLIFYIPLSLIVLYILFAIILIISSGGKWN